MNRLKEIIAQKIAKWKFKTATRWIEQFNYAVVRIVVLDGVEYMQVRDGSYRRLATVKQSRKAA